uniref:Uncharacterized protein n=1 Tax=Arundo donax TaxID=35708 RepID=A0A0A8ZS64_ARUDO
MNKGLSSSIRHCSKAVNQCTSTSQHSHITERTQTTKKA